jgi:hypothetical protein
LRILPPPPKGAAVYAQKITNFFHTLTCCQKSQCLVLVGSQWFHEFLSKVFDSF